MKNILFIGSESYDAATICLLQGLNNLGFDLYVLNRSNINSWFAEKVISVSEAAEISFLFAISNLHWGTRWDYYELPFIKKLPKILIDADDDPNIGSWKTKYRWYQSRYKNVDLNEIDSCHDLYPYRWVIDMGIYQPDIVFCCQRNKNNLHSVYLPFGIQDQWIERDAIKWKNCNRSFFMSHFHGPGIYRKIASKAINFLNLDELRLFNGSVYGEFKDFAKSEEVELDLNIHSWHRWRMNLAYFATLDNSEYVLYPGIDRYPFYDSKRPWESLARSAVPVMRKPPIFSSGFGLWEMEGAEVFDGVLDFRRVIHRIASMPSDERKGLRACFVKRAISRFSSQAIAEYFLFQLQISGISKC